MSQSPQAGFTTLKELTDFIDKKLCEDNILKPDAFPVTHRILRKRSEVCGMSFCLHGPRMVKFMAIWDIQTNRVLFYNPRGECSQITHINVAPTEEFILQAIQNKEL